MVLDRDQRALTEIHLTLDATQDEIMRSARERKQSGIWWRTEQGVSKPRMTKSISLPDAVSSHSSIIPIRTGGTNVPLFCFPGSGGNAHVFEEMAEALPKGHPIYASDMEWLCNAKRQFSVEQLASLYLGLIRKIQQNGPYYFCGYSFGGLIAYEIAVQLNQEGSGANLVALLDVPNPALISGLSQSDADRFRRVYLKNRLEKYGRLLLRGDIKGVLERGCYLITSRARRFLAPWVKIGLRTMNMPLPARLRGDDPAFLEAWRSYVPGRYAGRLVCFRAQDRGPEYEHDQSMGWDAYAAGGVDIHIVPGRHTDMLKRPHVSAISDELISYLDHRTNQQHRVGCVCPSLARPIQFTKE